MASDSSAARSRSAIAAVVLARSSRIRLEHEADTRAMTAAPASAPAIAATTSALPSTTGAVYGRSKRLPELGVSVVHRTFTFAPPVGHSGHLASAWDLTK